MAHARHRLPRALWNARREQRIFIGEPRALRRALAHCLASHVEPTLNLRIDLRIASCALLLAASTACHHRASSPADPHAVTGRPLSQLAGKRVLAILVPDTDPRVAYFVAGPASWTGTVLEVRVDSATIVRIPAGQGFASAMLKQVIVPQQLARVQAAARDADAVVAIFTRQPIPASALRIEMAFYGLARSEKGEALLMVGEP